jgi:Uma2 family endonuclease
MTITRIPPPARPRLTWDVARLYPEQGYWEESDYLELTQGSNRMVELSDGSLTVLPMPTTTHQLIVQYLVLSLFNFSSGAHLGTALSAPLRVRLWKGTFREPDVVFMLAEQVERMGEDFWDGADLVMEVVSGSARDRKRDLVTNRREYAIAGIAEYWIIDPRSKQITVLKRRGKSYVLHGEGEQGDQVSSALLKGFAVDVNAVFTVSKSKR